MHLEDYFVDKILIPELSTRPLKVFSIHEGGFGRVFEIGSYSGERYALKVLKWELGLDKAELIHEAEKLADLANHPNIAEVIGLYSLDGDPCIAMRYYPQTLSMEMAKGILSFSRVLELFNQIVCGLAFLHDEAGILHLDLKPQNILIDEAGTALISDFGISAVLPDPSQNSVTRDLFISGFVGTITYMSPEQLTTHKLNPKTDIFALGIVLFEMLTGRHPFLSTTFEKTAQNILLVTPTFSNSERDRIPSFIRSICMACLEKDPALRPTAAAIAKIITNGQFYESLAIQDSQVDSVRLINKASTLIAVGRLNEAQLILTNYLKSHPYDLSAAISLAEAYFLSNNMQKAIECAERALNTVQWFPSNQESVVTLLTNIADYYLSINPEKAIYYAQRATELDPYDWQAFGNVAEGCRVFGEANGRKDILNDGLEACRKGMKLNSNDLKLKITYGGLLLALEDYNTLWPYIVDLVNAYGGDDIYLRFLLIRTLIAVGEFIEAEKWIEPMRKYKELAVMVDIADKELARKRNKIQ